ncbi:MAG TPA: glycosyltransferase [Chloroflexota bacterium]|nr:glycosyltransferase [Chloroflexota bacterium]
MHIALVAPLVSVIHDDLSPLGGAQAFVGDLAHGLLAAGHRVTLLAANGSMIRGAAVPRLGIDAGQLSPADFSRPGPRTDSVEQRQAFERIRAWLEASGAQIDLVHGHAYDAPCFPALRGLAMPVVHTLHLPPLDNEVVQAVRVAQTSARMITVSRASERQWRDQGVSVYDSIHAGLDLDEIPFEGQPGAFLLFAGRITPEKGPDQAIDVAAALGQSLLLVGEIYDRKYFEQVIAPRVSIEREWSMRSQVPHGATYIGSRTRSELLVVMSHARGVLMPSLWDEPFGLVGIEAQATGTPVVAYRRGGLTEVVADGETGWLVPADDREEFRRRVSMLDTIDRRRCRLRIEEQFNIRRTVERYQAVYEEALREGLGT